LIDLCPDLSYERKHRRVFVPSLIKRLICGFGFFLLS
jgi:hypothetical protein